MARSDVLIVGAGPAGIALSCALADAGISSHVLEQAPLSALVAPPEDGRDIALTHRARRILTQLGLWDRLPAAETAPLRRAQVTSGNSPLNLLFDAADESVKALGWIVPNHRIREACFAGAMSRAGRVRLEGDAKVVGLRCDVEAATLTLADGRTLSAPLVAVYADRFSGRRFVLIGDAAVGMHPVTAHGYNFGLYGIETLTAELTRTRRTGRDFGDPRALKAYATEHRRAALPVYLGTNAIVKLFTSEDPLAHLVRGAVLRVARVLSPLRTAITRQLTDRHGAVPGAG